MISWVIELQNRSNLRRHLTQSTIGLDLDDKRVRSNKCVLHNSNNCANKTTQIQDLLKNKYFSPWKFGNIPIERYRETRHRETDYSDA